MENLGDSFWNMMVLMTTSNYPDVMLPAYQQNRGYFYFFGIYWLCQSCLHAAMIDPTVLLIAGVEGCGMILRISPFSIKFYPKISI